MALAPRANWKGFLKISEVACPVALYTAASTSDRITFHTLNRITGHRVHRQFIDSDTGEVVEKDDQVKGYEIGSGDYVVLEPGEIAAAIPESDKTLSIKAFVTFDTIDDVYFDKPYYLAPSDRYAEEVFALICEGMRVKKVAALAQAVLFRRVRTLLVRAHDGGLIATTLNFDYEVRSAAHAFDDVADLKIKKEMLVLAEHIIETKKGQFRPSEFNDRYETQLAELVKAKLEGKTINIPRKPEKGKVVDLMQALRESANLPKKKTSSAKEKTVSPRRKAG